MLAADNKPVHVNLDAVARPLVCAGHC